MLGYLDNRGLDTGALTRVCKKAGQKSGFGFAIMRLAFD